MTKQRIQFGSTGIVLLSSVLLCGGCGDAGVSTRAVTMDTVAGVITVINHDSGVWPAGDGWRLGKEVRIGDDPMAQDAYAFADISGLAVTDDGTIYVADGQALEIRAFAPDGEFLFRFGRSGEGPGEFAGLDAITVSPAGEIVARDPRLFRITRFSPDGAYLSDFRLNRPFPQYSGGFGLRVADDGTLFDRLSITRGIESPDSLALIMYAPDGAVVDTLLVAESPRQFVSVIVDGVPQMGMPVPFMHFASTVVGPAGSVARSFGDTYTFDVLDRDGTVIRSIRREVDALAITAHERDSAAAAMRETAARYTDGGVLQDFEFPAHKAAITHLLADADGHWWVGANNAASRTMHPGQFDVFTSEGRYLGAVAVPFRPYVIGSDFVAGVAVDDLGVQSVVVARLIREGDKPGGT